ncbi:MAG: hypothetical protein ACLP1X_13485 [Polyangiaceae bacterium]
MAESRLGLAGLAALGGGGAIVVIGLVVVGVRALSPAESNRPAASASAPGSEATKDGMRAAGTTELRQLGCGTALVMDMLRVLGDAANIREGDPRFIVTCDVPEGGAPTCERAAGAYFAALGGMGMGDVNVRVSRPGSLRPICSRLYAPSGADLGEYPRSN